MHTSARIHCALAQEEDYAAFDKRKDITKLRMDYKAECRRDPRGSNGERSKAIMARIHWIRSTLASRIVEERRKQYFREADLLRAKGMPTDGIALPCGHPVGIKKTPSTAVAMKIGEIFETFEASEFTEKENPYDIDWRNSIQLADVLRLYLADRKGKPGYMFETPFKCPECYGSVHGDIEIKNVIHWSNHTESVHGWACSFKPPPSAKMDYGIERLAKSVPSYGKYKHGKDLLRSLDRTQADIRQTLSVPRVSSVVARLARFSIPISFLKQPSHAEKRSASASKLISARRCPVYDFGRSLSPLVNYDSRCEAPMENTSPSDMSGMDIDDKILSGHRMLS
ncbi:hypothetical protein F4810DRAFT_716168 [Camillea tinctor]|nr:hypothetical protein F4810DRAFT_716168 [Camillea tinctor]